jgi:hypothetical protein
LVVTKYPRTELLVAIFLIKHLCAKGLRTQLWHIRRLVIAMPSVRVPRSSPKKGVNQACIRLTRCCIFSAMNRTRLNDRLRWGALLFTFTLCGLACSSSATLDDSSRDTSVDSRILANLDVYPDQRSDGSLQSSDGLASDGQNVTDSRSFAPNNRKCYLVFGDSDCRCANSTPGATDPPACSEVSVASAEGQQGVCCEDTSVPYCECLGYTCLNSEGSATCTCGRIDTFLEPADSAAVTNCPAPTESQKCYLNTGLHTCTCSTEDFSGTGTVEVATCSLAQVAICDTGSTSWPSCK